MTFPNEDDLEHALKRQRKRAHCCEILPNQNGKQAPEPEDIIWHNWSLSAQSRFYRKILSYFLIMAVVAIDFAILLGLKVLQNYLSEKASRSSVAFLSFASNFIFSLTMIIVNTILYQLAQRLSFFQKNTTVTVQAKELTSFYLFAIFFNTVLLTLMVNRIIKERDWNLFGSTGTTGNVFSPLILFLFFEITLLLLDPWYLMKVFKRWQLNRKLKQVGNSVVQCEANETFEKDDLYSPEYQ